MIPEKGNRQELKRCLYDTVELWQCDRCPEKSVYTIRQLVHIGYMKALGLNPTGETLCSACAAQLWRKEDEDVDVRGNH